MTRSLVAQSALILKRTLAAACLAGLTLGCNPEETAAPESSAAEAAPVADLTTSAAPFSPRFAFALADLPSSPSYAPSLSFSGTGGGVRITHTGFGGGYAVTFGGFQRAAGETEVFIVSSYGSTRAHCVGGFVTLGSSSVTVNVFCSDPVNDLGTDAQFTILAVGSNSLPARSAFAYANLPSSPLYTPDPNFSYTSSAGAISISHDSLPGSYKVNYGTGKPAGSVILINSRLTPFQCQVSSWLANASGVRCFDAFTAQPVNADYQILQVGAGRAGKRIGYAYANQRNVASYTPDPAFSRNSSGGAIKATRSAAGRYAVTFNGLQRPAGRTEIVQVTPYGSSYANCAVRSWTSLAASLRANVECRNAAGNFADSRFEILVIE